MTKFASENPDILERFWSKIDVLSGYDTGCWNWIGSVSSEGYVNININNKCIRTHRLSYKLFRGKIPEHLLVCHKCDNPSCVNPSHLFLGTNHENIYDSINKGRRADFKGTKNPRAILTEDQVKEIRILYSKGAISQAKLAKKFNTNKFAIFDI